MLSNDLKNCQGVGGYDIRLISESLFGRGRSMIKHIIAYNKPQAPLYTTIMYI
jgi:hypothetical protein